MQKMTLILENEKTTKSKIETSFSSQLESKSELSASDQKVIENRNNRFFYCVAGLNILLEQDINAENLSQPKVYNLPHSPEWCTGIVNVRGNIIPILNVHVLLQTGVDMPVNKSKLLLFKHKKIAPIIFQIDQLPSMIDFDDYTISTNPNNSPHWMKKTFKSKSNIIHEVNHFDLLKTLNN